MSIEELRQKIKERTNEDCRNTNLLDKYQRDELENIWNYTEEVNAEGYQINGFSEAKGQFSIFDNTERGGLTFILRPEQYRSNEE